MIKKMKLLASLLDRSERNKAAILVLFTLTLAVFDVASLAAVLPIMGLLFQPDSIYEIPYLPKIYKYSSFNEIENFALTLFVVLIIFFLFKNLLYLILTKLQSKFSYQVAINLSSKQFDVYFKRNLEFFNEQNSFLVMRNLTSIPIEFSANVLLQLLTIISESIIIMIIVTGIFYVNPIVLVISILSFLPAYIIFYQISKRKLAKLLEIRSIAYTRVNNYISESIHGFQELKLKGKEKYFKRRYIKDFKIVGDVSAEHNQFVNAPVKIMEILAIFSLMLLVIYFLNSEFKTEKILVILSVFLASAYRIIPSSNKIIAGLTSIKSAKYVLDVYKEDLIGQELEKNQIVDEPIEFKTSINLTDINFKFKGSEKKYLLKELNLKIKKFETIGIIGKSGSGKSTLINLMLGFLSPEAGRITLDDKPLSNTNIKAFRNKVGFVKQNTFILNGTLAENIVFGNDPEEIPIKKIEKAIYLSGLGEWYEQNGKNLNLKLGENGTKISGGQKQRIAIARALFEKCEILIFDEATSSLDNQTEELINDSIKQLKKEGLTMIIIAHRFSSLEHCDKIYELENGALTLKTKFFTK